MGRYRFVDISHIRIIVSEMTVSFYQIFQLSFLKNSLPLPRNHMYIMERIVQKQSDMLLTCLANVILGDLKLLVPYANDMALMPWRKD